jgi:hypothetical protein
MRSDDAAQYATISSAAILFTLAIEARGGSGGLDHAPNLGALSVS